MGFNSWDPGSFLVWVVSRDILKKPEISQLNFSLIKMCILLILPTNTHYTNVLNLIRYKDQVWLVYPKSKTREDGNYLARAQTSRFILLIGYPNQT